MPRNPRRNSFATALADAEKRLAAAQRKKQQAEATVADLAQEIPRLQGIIRALGGDPGPAAVPPGICPPPMSVAFASAFEARGLGEIPEGAGSIPVVNPEAEPRQADAPDIDSLPGMEGDFQ